MNGIRWSRDDGRPALCPTCDQPASRALGGAEHRLGVPRRGARRVRAGGRRAAARGGRRLRVRPGSWAIELSGLRNLPQHRWGFRIAIAAATIGIIYGYDLGAIAGALLFITKDFDLSTKQTEWVATIVVVGSIVGALTGGRLANAIGRKPAMVLVALTYAVFRAAERRRDQPRLPLRRALLPRRHDRDLDRHRADLRGRVGARGGARRVDRHVPGGHGDRDRGRVLRRLRAGRLRLVALDARALRHPRARRRGDPRAAPRHAPLVRDEGRGWRRRARRSR